MVDVNDSLTSYVSGLGTARDKMTSAHYMQSMVSDFELVNAYNSSWIAKKIVDIPAFDAIKSWRNWQADADVISIIEAEESRVGLRDKILSALISARLLGWSAIYVSVGDEDPSLPLNVNKIGKDGLKFITVLSKRDIIPGEIDTDPLSPYYGTPSHYQVAGSSSVVSIHPSRIAIIVGEKAPPGADIGLFRNQPGVSTLQSCYGAIKNADSTTANIASLVFESNVDVFGVPDLMASFSDPDYHRRLIERFSLAATAKGINRALIRDKDEEYDRKQISFGGLDAILEAMLEQVCGAADIPATRLLGKSPGGLSSAGESDMNNYYDKIRGMQSLVLAGPLRLIDQVLIRSAIGGYPDDVFYTWPPLEVANEKERAEIGKMNADTAAVLVGTGLFLPEELRGAVSNQLIESSFYPGLESEMDNSDDNDIDLSLAAAVEEAINGAEEQTAISPLTAEAPPSHLQASALNGAQVSSLIEIVMAIVEKRIPEESAKIVISNAFPAVSSDDVESMIASARSFNSPKEAVDDDGSGRAGA